MKRLHVRTCTLPRSDTRELKHRHFWATDGKKSPESLKSPFQGGGGSDPPNTPTWRGAPPCPIRRHPLPCHPEHGYAVWKVESTAIYFQKLSFNFTFSENPGQGPPYQKFLDPPLANLFVIHQVASSHLPGTGWSRLWCCRQSCQTQTEGWNVSVGGA